MSRRITRSTHNSVSGNGENSVSKSIRDDVNSLSKYCTSLHELMDKNEFPEPKSGDARLYAYFLSRSVASLCTYFGVKMEKQDGFEERKQKTPIEIASVEIDALYNMLAPFEESKKCIGDMSKIIPFLQHVIKGLGKEEFCLEAPKFFNRMNVSIKNGKLSFSNALQDMVMKCSKNFVILPLLMQKDQTLSAHENLVFINRLQKTYERFEPNGHFSHYGDMANPVMGKEFKEAFGLKGYTYVPPEEACRIGIGPQHKAGNGVKQKCKAGGYCVVFSTIYAHLRILLPNLNAEDILDAWMQWSPAKIDSMMHKYQTWIDEVIPDGVAEKITKLLFK
jgi:hypothetical protein